MIAVLAWLAGTRIGRITAAATAAILGALALYGKGRRDARQAGEHERLKDYAETRKRADEALARAEADQRSADERLEEHGRLRHTHDSRRKDQA